MTLDPEPRQRERRQHQRVAFNAAAELQTKPAMRLPIRTRNISLGGLSVLHTVELAPETRCIVHAVIPESRGDSTPVQLRGRVVNCQFNKIEGGFMVSLQFIDLSASVAATIARFMHGRQGAH